MYKSVGPVEGVEGRDQAIEGIALRRAGSRPRGQSHAVPEAAGEVEQVDGASGPELRHGLLERLVEIDQIRGDVVAPEQRIRQRSPAVEYLVGKLAPQHQIIGDSFARDLLRQRVERLHADGGEREQVVVTTAMHDERVAMPGAGLGDRGDRVPDRHVPGQAGALGNRRGRNRKAGRH